MAAWLEPSLDSVELPEPAVALRVCPDGRRSMEGARTPIRFRDRVLAQFRSPENERYLRGLLAGRMPRGGARALVLSTLGDALYTFAEKEGRALDVLLSDPTAQRGRGRGAVSLWDEVRRLNLAFAEDRLRFAREQAAQLAPRPEFAGKFSPRDGVSADDEPYHYRMFVSDSLRPPGLEHLNTPGPLYALREDQSTWNRPRPARQPAGPAARPSPGPAARPSPAPVARSSAGSRRESFAPRALPWGRGDLNPGPAQAVAEYWSDTKATEDTAVGSSEFMGETYGAESAWGEDWPDRGGTRFMRYESPPFWQKGGREGYDYDIEETLGASARETDNHVRRWDMDRLREPRGDEHHALGPRSGHFV
ncbi:MAG TPA: hypothetical protein VNI01_03260 [Elusimicrobiota bacterium]|jgi:hypothetical protein|nr:hypothetical protein [Elusimicrobiota bacterium]